MKSKKPKKQNKRTVKVKTKNRKFTVTIKSRKRKKPEKPVRPDRPDRPIDPPIDPPDAVLNWPYQPTPYLSALPGVAGPGLDVTDPDKPSKIYFITSYDDEKVGGAASEYGPNCYAGTFMYCWYADQGEDFHKWIIPLIGGYVHIGRKANTPYGRGDMDYVGHAAPGAGLFIQTCAMRICGGSNVRVWHLPAWVGDKPEADGQNFPADQRDGLQCGSNDYYPKDVAFINCEARFAMDESVEVFYDVDGISWIRGAVYDPLHSPPNFAMGDGSHHEAGEDHGYGHIIAGGGLVDRSLVSQSLYAHTTDRNPLVSARNHASVNVLNYDHGRPSVGKGEGLNFSNNGGHCKAQGYSMQCNMVGCVSVRGPNNSDQLCFARTWSDLPDDSTGHVALNSQFGWPAVDAQEDFFTTKFDGFLQPSLRESAWPNGYGSDYAAVLQPAKEPLAPTLEEGLAFVNLMRRTVGCMPARRHLYAGGVGKVCDQIEAAIQGVESESQWVDTVEEAGGWPTMPKVSIDPLNPGMDYHAPIPLGADRDEPCMSGTFVDGSSKVGYSKLRAWVIDQYFYTLGR